MKTLGDLKWLLTAGKPSPALKAATLLYLHGVRINASIGLKVRDIDFASPTSILVGETRHLFGTDELSVALRELASGKSGEDVVLGYRRYSEFYREFRLAARAARLYKFDVSDVTGMFRDAAGGDYALLKQYESAQPFTLDDVRKAWLKVLPRLVVGV